MIPTVSDEQLSCITLALLYTSRVSLPHQLLRGLTALTGMIDDRHMRIRTTTGCDKTSNISQSHPGSAHDTTTISFSNFAVKKSSSVSKFLMTYVFVIKFGLVDISHGSKHL